MVGSLDRVHQELLCHDQVFGKSKCKHNLGVRPCSKSDGCLENLKKAKNLQ